MKMVYLFIGVILIIDAAPLLFPFPQDKTYLDETPEGQITVTYESKEQYFRERTLPVTSFTLFITSGVYFYINSKYGGQKDAG